MGRCVGCEKANCETPFASRAEHFRHEVSKEIVYSHTFFEGIPAGPGFRQGIGSDVSTHAYYNTVGVWLHPQSGKLLDIGVRWDFHCKCWNVASRTQLTSLVLPGELRLKLKEMYGLTFP